MILETYKKGNRAIYIHQDDDAESPMRYSGVTIYHRNNDHVLGKFIEDRDTLTGVAKEYFEGGVCLRLFMLDHSGIALSTEPFGCPWDSGQIGFAGVPKSFVLDEFAGDLVKAEAYVKSSIEVYSTYLGGECYGYVEEIMETCELCGNEEDTGKGASRWGFIGRDHLKSGLEDLGINLEEWTKV